MLFSSQLTYTDIGSQDVTKRTIEAYEPLQTGPLVPPNVSSTTFFAKTDGSIRGVPSSPFARAKISFSIALYFDVCGSLRLTPAARVFVRTAPVLTVTTLTPKGASSSRSVSLIVVTAAFEAA